jgi:hypothetical protein
MFNILSTSNIYLSDEDFRLSISNRHIAVDILGGNLGVRSDGEGRGAEFFVDAPFEVLELQKDMASAPGLRSVLRGKKVLISDRPESMLLLRDILTPFGAECVCMEESTPHKLEVALGAHDSFDVVLVYASVLTSICEAEWVALVEKIEKRWPHCVAILLHSLGHGARICIDHARSRTHSNGICCFPSSLRADELGDRLEFFNFC